MASNIFMSEENSDVTLKVLHETYSWRMPAHTLLLETKSAEFRDMLAEQADNDRPCCLSIVGVRPESVEAMLKYIYNDEYPTDVTSDLLIASDKFRLQPLKDNLEERVMSDMTLRQACRMLQELLQRQSGEVNCAITIACQDMLESHALAVFGSDMIMLFSKRTLVGLMNSDRLNIHDEAFLFWGIWRWGKRECSKRGLPLTDESVAKNTDDLIVLVRHCSVLSRKGIPKEALLRFNQCRGRRQRYGVPRDILKHTSTLRFSPVWDDLVPSRVSEDGDILCAQFSFEKDVMVVGMALEACPNEQITNLKVDSFIRLKREVDGVELRRQQFCWSLTRPRRTSANSKPECRLESELIFKIPVFLTAGNIYSIYLRGNFTNISLAWSSIPMARQKVGHTFVNIHADGVTAVRELYLMPDMSATWGPRVPDV